MAIRFLIKALSTKNFQKFMVKSDEELDAANAKWLKVDVDSGYPCRVSLIDADIGERVLVLPFCHHNVNSPYRSSGPIFVRESAETAELAIGEVPDMLRPRLLSVRGYDSAKLMIEAQVLNGTELESAIERQFQNSSVEYIHIHNANPGCFNCSVIRA